MITVVSAILLILAFLLYWREFGTRGGYWLFILRVVIVLILGWMALDRVVTVRWTQQPRRVAFLVDRSRSMEMIGVDSVVDRVLRSLQERIVGVKQEVWWFGDSVIKLGPGGQAAQPGKERTRLGRALEVVSQTGPAAILLLSDGQDNGQVDAMQVAQRLAVPVYTVGFGGNRGRNLMIKELEIPAVAYAQDTVVIRVRLASIGFINQERCRLRLDGQTKEVTLARDWSEEDVFFRVVFTESGNKTVWVGADSLPDELSYIDNQCFGSIEIKPARTRIVYITNHPGPQTRFIRRMLEKDIRFDVKNAIALTGGLNRMARLLDSADVFVVDNAAEVAQDREFWNALRSRVEGGVGVFLLAGDGFKAGEQLEKLLPIKGGQLLRGEWTPMIAEPALFLPGLREDGLNFASVPPFSGIWAGTVANEQATVWMTAQENQAPLLVAGKAGKGKVVYLGAFPLWRWGFLADVLPDKPTPLDVFLSGTVRYLSEKDTSLFSLKTDALDYLTGERITLLLDAKALDGTPWEGLDVRIAVQDSLGNHFYIPMQEMGSGRYRAEIDGLAPGRYFAFAEVRAENRLRYQTAPVEFRVTEQSVEIIQLGINRDLLSRIASLTGGWFIPADSIDEIATREFRLGVYHRSFSLDPRKIPVIYGLVALLFGLEIILRRQRGLL